MENSQITRQKKSVWFEDGDLIIKVAKDNDLFFHRVHSSILRHHSEVFRDMLVFSGGGEQEMVQGCPVIQFHDAPRDMFLFLKALYFPGAIPHQKLRQATFDTLKPVIQLADKYQMRVLTSQLLHILERDWPSSLAEWDANEAEIKTAVYILEPEKFERQFGDYEGKYYADQLLPEPCKVIRLARECGFPSLLPAAFYHLFRTQLERGDEMDDADYPELYEGARRVVTKYLRLEDWQSLNRGMLEIRKWCSQFMYRLRQDVRGGHQEEDGRMQCSTQGFIDSMNDKLILPYVTRGMDPLKILLECKEDEDNAICYSCEERINEKIQKGREDLWDNLPSMFNLPNVPGGERPVSLDDDMDE